MQVGDLVTHNPDTGILGIVMRLTKNGHADVHWVNGRSAGMTVLMWQGSLEVICK